MTRLVLIPLVLAACFGAGPTPKPSEVQIVFAPQNTTDCGGNATYIGDLALTPAGGLALTLPFEPFGCNQGSMSPQGPQSVYMFDPNGSGGSSGAMIASLGSSQTNGPPGARLVAAGAAGPMWIYSQGGNGGSLNIGSPSLVGGAPVMLNNSGGGPNQLGGFPLAIAFDPVGQDVYVAAITSGAPSTDPDSPTFPCCGTSSGISSAPVAIAALPTNLGTGSLVSQSNFQFAFGALPDAMVDDNAGHLFYLSSAAQNAVTLVDLDGTMTATVQSHIMQPDPVGLSTDGQTVVFSLSPLLQDNNSTTPPPACEIYAFDIATQQVMPLLQTASFSCMDAHIDAGAVYFAITSAPPEPNCPSCGPVVHGEGIGRIALADRTFESLAIGVAGAAAGPRHIYTQNAAIFAADPLAVVRIDETALTGAHDFMP